MTGTPIVLRDGTGAEHRVRVGSDGEITIDDATLSVKREPDGSLRVPGGRSAVIWTAVSGASVWVFADGEVFVFERTDGIRPRTRTPAHLGPLTAPMPATVRRVAVTPGDRVQRGDVLVVLEAMKMELPVRAAADGLVVSVTCTEGELVQAGASLVEIDGDRA
jgi:biotin carboxyl carrier protein